MSQLTTTHKDYNDSSFWNKVKESATSVGKKLLYQVFCLYYALQNPAMPLALKLSVMASLAYFICPIDAIPDMIPVLGYTDDAGVIAATLTAIEVYVDDSVKSKARQAADDFFA